MVDEHQPRRRLPRAQRREQILAAATKAFARNGFAATGLDDIAAEAGITRVILYRHFDSKTDLYQAVAGPLLRPCSTLTWPSRWAGSPTPASTACSRPRSPNPRPGSGCCSQHAAREPEFKDRSRAVPRRHHRGRPPADLGGRPRSGAGRGGPRSWPRRSAIEAIIAWLDAGQPDPDLAADRVRQRHRRRHRRAAAARMRTRLPAPHTPDSVHLTDRRTT